MTYTNWIATALIALTLGGASLSHAQGDPDLDALGLTKVQIDHQGGKRTFYYHGTIDKDSARKPVLFVLHGGGGSATSTAENSGYSEQAARDGFLVIYPEGLEGNWNDGRGGTTGTGVDISTIDDVGFFKKVFSYTTRHLRGDASRFYLTGISNGGLMSYRLGIELTDRVAAIAPVAANIPVAIADGKPQAPLPTLIMNGTADPLMPWAGGTSAWSSGDSEGVLSTYDSVAFWVLNNGGGRCATSYRTEHLPDLDTTDSSTVEVTTYSGLQAPVVLYTIHGGGHTMPGGTSPAPERLVGATNKDIVGREVIWAFVSQFRRKR